MSVSKGTSFRARFLWRPLRSALAWAGTGFGAGLLVPSIIAKSGAGSIVTIYSTSLITTAFWGGSLAILLPLGLARGVISASMEVMDTTGKEAILQAYHQASTGTQLSPSSGPSGSENDSPSLDAALFSKEILERMTLGGGWSGRAFRTLASPFFPSTSQMLVRVQEALDKPKANAATGKATDGRGRDGEVVAAAVAGYAEGFLQDKKDTLTLVGCFLYAIVVAFAFGADQALRRTNEKRKEFQDAMHTRNQRRPMGEDQESPSLRQKIREAFSVKQETSQVGRDGSNASASRTVVTEISVDHQASNSMSDAPSLPEDSDSLPTRARKAIRQSWLFDKVLRRKKGDTAEQKQVNGDGRDSDDGSDAAR